MITMRVCIAETEATKASRQVAHTGPDEQVSVASQVSPAPAQIIETGTTHTENIENCLRAGLKLADAITWLAKPF